MALSEPARRILEEFLGAHADPAVTMAQYAQLWQEREAAVMALSHEDRQEIGWQMFKVSFKNLTGREPSPREWQIQLAAYKAPLN